MKEMQGALQAELHEDHLQLFGLLGRGGFGTVYHGTSASDLFCMTSLEIAPNKYDLFYLMSYEAES